MLQIYETVSLRGVVEKMSARVTLEMSGVYKIKDTRTCTLTYILADTASPWGYAETVWYRHMYIMELNN